MLEGIKIITALECVRDFIPKDYTNIRQSMLIVLVFQNGHFNF